MSNPQHSNPKDRRKQARAPYNFVPLPEQAIDPPSLEADSSRYDEYGLPHHDRYHARLYSGKIICTITTRSPLYTRVAPDPELFEKVNKLKENLYIDLDAQKQYAQFFHHGSLEKPVIPGSSLRGMVRTLVEIIGHGSMRWVGKEPTFTFRAVAAQRDDPLRESYQEVIGRFGRNVRAGYLAKDGDQWLIQPAVTPKEMGWPGSNEYFIKVKERDIPSGAISRLRRLNDPDYAPSWHPVQFNIQQTRRSVRLTEIGDYGVGYRYAGVLACSGNMIETANSDQDRTRRRQESPRRNHALVLIPNRKSAHLPIDEQAIKDYLAGLTSFQTELKDWGGEKLGCLREGAPVFYVSEQDNKGKETVRYFGHSPNFRIPARLDGTDQAATPLDFVPSGLRNGERLDLAEAIFGWVAENSGQGPKEQRAGRVFFGDAKFQRSQNGLWLENEPIALRTLSGPKPTTFQHYLVQDRQRRHDPDQLSTLAHYGTSPEETQIRGYKLYWPKGESPDIKASVEEQKHPKQLTQVKPVRSDVEFQCTISFENLSKVELGALLWTLYLPGEGDVQYCHRLGMGKPLGMGVIIISPRLLLDDRQARYSSLFAQSQWDLPMEPGDVPQFTTAFEQFILSQVMPTARSLSEVPRIRTLLTLLEWRDGNADWVDQTRYMEIEHGTRKENEYKDRPVLPTPETVAQHYTGISLRKVANATLEETLPLRPEVPADVEVKSLSEEILSSDEHEDLALVSGVVESYGHGKQKSFGFIRYENEDGEEKKIFVHRSQLTSALSELRPKQEVRFSIGPGMNGPEAKNVRPA